MKSELTAAQKEVYDSIKTNCWFLPDDVMLFKNYRSHLRKLTEKGFLETRLFSNPENRKSYISRIQKYRKIMVKGAANAVK